MPGSFRLREEPFGAVIVDGDPAGWQATRLKFGPSAGLYVTASPAVGVASYILARTDLIAQNGAEAVMIDVPKVVVSSAGKNVGSRWRADGVQWNPMAPVTLLQTLGGVAGTADTTERLANTTTSNPTQVLLPAGLINANNRRFRIYWAASKTGTVDTATIRIRMGTAGTTADTVIATAILAATNQSGHGMWEFQRASATTLQYNTQDPLQAGTAAALSSGNTTASSAWPANVTVSSMDTNALYITGTLQMTTGAETPTLRSLVIELLP